MARSIENYINHISRDVDDERSLTYYGDGIGDFEKRSLATTDACLLKYIETCNLQSKIAKDELKRRSHNLKKL